MDGKKKTFPRGSSLFNKNLVYITSYLWEPDHNNF